MMRELVNFSLATTSLSFVRAQFIAPSCSHVLLRAEEGRNELRPYGGGFSHDGGGAYG